MIMKRLCLIIMIVQVCIASAIQAQTTLTLEECKKMAIENNYDLKNSYLDRQIAEQSRKEAFTSYFPQVEAMGGYMAANKGLISLQMPNPATGGLMDLSMFKNGKTAAITAMQPIFAGGQIINGNKLAKIGERVSALQIKLTEREIEKKTELYFWQIVQLEEKSKTLNEMQILLKSISKDIEIAVKAGISSKNDLLRIELQEFEIETSQLKVENGLRTSKLLLSQLIGLSGSDLSLSYADNELTTPLDIYVDPEEAVLRCPETSLLEQSIEASKLQKKMEIGKQLPNLAVGAGYMFHDLMGDDFNAGIVMVNLSVPVSGWWKGSYAIKKQTLKMKQAQNTKQNNIELLKVGIEQSWNELRESYKQILLSKQAIGLAEENLRMSRQSYQAGIMTLSELLETQSLLQDSADKYIEAYTNYQYKMTE